MKLEQALELDPPHEIHFKGPFNEVTTSYLKLTNPTDRQIGFKVKTTAPKTYCVRPNGGYILPKKSVSVAVMLQPFDPDNDNRSRDKFMVQSVFVPEGETFTDSLWQDSEALMNSKLKCVFARPETIQVTADVVDHRKTESAAASKDTQEVKVVSDKVREEDPEGKKLHEENKRLQSELHNLRQENSSLKEEGMRARMTTTRTKSTSPVHPESPNPRQQAANKNAVSLFSPLALAAFLTALLVGIVIGKINIF